LDHRQLGPLGQVSGDFALRQALCPHANRFLTDSLPLGRPSEKI
jgi:hypothetical protein